MKDQKGAALIVVLSMLTVSLILGLTSMQSSQIDERLAGNYKAAAQAQMAAEVAASKGSGDEDANINSVDDIEGAIPWISVQDDSLGEYLEASYIILDKGAAEYLEDSYVEGWGDGWESKGDFFVLGRGVVNQGGSEVRREILVSVVNDGFGLDAVFNCLGYQCVEDRVSAEGALDGEDHPVSGQAFNCNGQGCRYPHDEDLGSIEKFSGLEPGDSGYDARRAAWQDVVNNIPEPSVTYNGGKVGSHGTREDPVVIEIAGDVKISSNSDTAGIIIVRAGGSISKANGTAHHEGLIIVEEGGKFDMSNGTFNLYGGIVKLKPEASNGHNDPYDLVVGGNARISYSSEAVANLQKLVDIQSFLSSAYSGRKINAWVGL